MEDKFRTWLHQEAKLISEARPFVRDFILIKKGEAVMVTFTDGTYKEIQVYKDDYIKTLVNILISLPL